MRYVFGNHYGQYDLFKILFDSIVTDLQHLTSIRKMMNDEDVVKEELGCYFYDDYGRRLEKVEIVFLDETLKLSREELYQLLTIGIKKYLNMYSEDTEEMKKILYDLIDRCEELTERIPEDFYSI